MFELFDRAVRSNRLFEPFDRTVTMPPIPRHRSRSPYWYRSRSPLTMPTIELALTFRRRRNLLILAVLALIPLAVGLAVRLAGVGAGGGTGLLNQVAGNGLFLVFASLALTVPLF